MRQIWEIARKDLYLTFTDRNNLLLMFAAPVLLATIIAVTFGGAGSNDGPIQNIRAAIVNLDTGADGQNFGQIIADILARPEDYDEETSTDSLDRLIDGQVYATREEALRDVETMEMGVAVIIPEDFTTNIMPRRDASIMSETPINGARIEVHGTPAFSISTTIVESVVNSIASQIAAGNVAAAAIVQSLIQAGEIENITTIMQSDVFLDGISNVGNTSDIAAVRVDRQTTSGQAMTFNPLVMFGGSQAIFFALFASIAAATSVIEERRDYTLQRLIMSPTSRHSVLLGKMMGTFVMVLLQLLFLFIAFTLVASLMSGSLIFIWGTDIVGIIAVMIATAVAVTGLGAIVASIARTPDQSNTVGSVITLAMALLGGGFGFQLGAPVQYASIIYWGTDAYRELAAGLNTYWPNIAVLIAFGVVTFGIALILFSRRLRNWS